MKELFLAQITATLLALVLFFGGSAILPIHYMANIMGLTNCPDADVIILGLATAIIAGILAIILDFLDCAIGEASFIAIIGVGFTISCLGNFIFHNPGVDIFDLTLGVSGFFAVCVTIIAPLFSEDKGIGMSGPRLQLALLTQFVITLVPMLNTLHSI